MLGSLYCTDWAWFGCPIAHKAQYCRRDHGPDPFICLRLLHHKTYGYGMPFLSDDDHKRLQYKAMHEGARKDVEHAFGALKKEWAILATPARGYIKEKLANIMYICIILHNLILKDRKEAICPEWYLEEEHQPDDLLRSNEQRHRIIRDTIQLEDVVSTISEEYLQEFASEYYVPESLHPELPSLEDNIVDFREGKVGVYTKNFKFTNYRIPISQFLFDILCHFQIHLSQLSVIGAAKVSHFKINCRVLNIRPTRTSALKDERPAADSYSAVDVATLNLHRTPIQKEPEELLCLVGLCRNYFLRDDENPTFLYDDDREMDLFNLINAPNPLKVKTGACPRLSHEVPLLTATASCVINMENTPTTSVSSETPPVIVKSPLDFSNEQSLQLLTEGDETETQVPTVVASEVPRAENPATTGVVPELNLEKEAATMGPSLNKRDKGEAEANALPRVLRKDHASIRPQLSTSAVLQSMSEPDPLSYAQPKPLPEQDIA
ncbi:gypsy type transposase [Tanacetum coccineum]